VSPFTVAWITLGVLVAVAFGIIEGIALTNSRHGDTLSEHTWAWFGYDREGRKSRKGWARFRRFILLVGLLWVVLHFVTGGWY
jgi:predicted outer membrane lipoprotein